MKLTLVTPTGDRPEAFRLCERYMARQIVTPHEWFVLDDGLVPMTTTLGQKYIRCPEYSGRASLPQKIARVIREATGDAIVVIEDDDWYCPRYLHTMVERFAGADLVGETQAIYYNVPTRTWHQHTNTKHASLCQTAWRRSVDRLVLAQCASKDPFIDLRIWTASATAPRLRRNLVQRLATEPVCTARGWEFRGMSPTVVGIKGMPGRLGYGSGHKPLPKPDRDGELLRHLLGSDALPYLNQVYS